MAQYNVEIRPAKNKELGYIIPVSYIDGKVGRRLEYGPCSRHIYFHRGVVVKIDTCSTGETPPEESQCHREYLYWKSAQGKPDILAHLAPILQYGHSGGYRYVVMPRYYFVAEKKKLRAVQEVVDRIVEKYSLKDIKFYGDGGDNWAVTKDDRIIIYDYGVCEIPA